MRPGFVDPITAPADQLEDHSPIGFSGWDRHSNCHGSVALASLCPPSPTSAAAGEGLIAHAAAAYWLLNGKAQKGLDTDMENYIRHYVYYVWDKLPKKRVNGNLWLVEGRVAAPSIHAECRGTVDSLIWCATTRVLQIHDLKYGKFPVDAERNQQLMGYAICAREQFCIDPLRVELYIHQVRSDKVPSKWVVPDIMDLDLFEDDVREHVAAIERQRAVLKRTKDPKRLDLNAGDHCRYCAAWSRCHERLSAAAREGIDLLMPVPAVLPPDAGKLVAFAEKALPWAKAVLKAARAHAIQGGAVPGRKLVAGRRHKAWLDEKTVAEKLAANDYVRTTDLYTTPKLKSPTQIRSDVLPAGQIEFDELWEWQPGAPLLVPEGDKRPPYKIRPEDYLKVIGSEDEEEPSDDY